jgi:hypothetical protein
MLRYYSAEESVIEPWRLFRQGEGCMNVYGWADAGVTANGQFNGSRYNGVTTFNDRHEGMLNQFYVVTERTIDTGGCGFDWGGRLDLLYGSDYIFTQATGLETNPDGTNAWNGSPFYGLAMPQAYAELGYSNLSAKFGHFYTPIGYESVMAPNNFFYSHAYTMQYGEPFTHTGALATYRLNDQTSFVGGIVNGWDGFDRVSDPLAYLAGATWSNGDALSIAFNVITGEEPTLLFSPAGGGFTPRHMYSLVVSYQFNDCWTYVFQHDLAHQDDAAALATNLPGIGATAPSGTASQYVFRKINDAGQRLPLSGSATTTASGDRHPPDAEQPVRGPGSFAGNFYEMTAGVNWKPNQNIIVRPEVRYDWYDGLELTGIEPFNDGNRTDQFLAGLDVILLW